MTIKFNKKFTSIHLDKIIEDYWIKTKNCPEREQIIFNFDETEWISMEEIVFLFGWFRYLADINKSIKIRLPDFRRNYKLKNSFINLWCKWKIYSLYYDKFYDQNELEDIFEVDVTINNIVTNMLRYDDYKEINDIGGEIKIVPFQALKASGYGDINAIDDFLINKIQKPLNLYKEVSSFLLNELENEAINETKLLSKIITNELFLNVLHHSAVNSNNIDLECYFAISLKKNFTIENIKISENRKRSFTNSTYQKISNSDAELILKQRVQEVLPYGFETERPQEILDYFKNTSTQYRNEKFIEFTFIDFGQGIPNSLKKIFLEDMNNIDKEFIKNDLNFNFSLQNIDTQILEYSFLLNSSRHPFDLDFQLQYEIPRGLYFLIDIVRRFNGLVEVRSGRGKIAYNFKKDVEKIKEAVVYFKNDKILPHFQGTKISITIPLKQEEKYQNLTKSNIKFQTKLSKKENIHIRLIDIEDRIDKQYLRIYQKKPTLQETYRELFNEFNKLFDERRDKSTLFIFDFAGFNVLPIDHKVLFYFCSSPRINELNSVVIINFNNVELIKEVKKSVLFKLKNNLEKNHFFKPIPIITSENNIEWLGVMNTLDEKKLSELLLYSDYQISKTDLSHSENYIGHFFNIDKYGNVTSNILTQSEIIDIIKNGK